MTYLNKVLYRKYLADLRANRLSLNAPAWHDVCTGLDFNVKTRTRSYWDGMNRIQALRASA